MILVDSSAWIEYDRATESAIERRVTELIDVGAPLAVTEPVVMEVVVGARTEQRERQLRRLLGRFTLLPFDAQVDFDEAARIYRACRSVGVTPRGTVDCMIAAVASRHGVSLLAFDADLARVAGVIGVAMDPASRLT